MRAGSHVGGRPLHRHRHRLLRWRTQTGLWWCPHGRSEFARAAGRAYRSVPSFRFFDRPTVGGRRPLKMSSVLISLCFSLGILGHDQDPTAEMPRRRPMERGTRERFARGRPTRTQGDVTRRKTAFPPPPLPPPIARGRAARLLRVPLSTVGRKRGKPIGSGRVF